MKKIIGIFLIFSLIFVSSAEAKREKNDYKPTLSNIVKLVADGDFKRAGKMLKKLEKKLRDITEADTQFIMGYVNYKMDEFTKAKEYFLKAAEGPSKIEDHINYFTGSCCFKTKDYDCAINNFSSIVENYPESVWFSDASWDLVNSFIGAGDYNAAWEILSKIKPNIKIGLTDSEYNFVKAFLLEKLGRVDEAASLLETIYFNAETYADSERAKVLLQGLNTPKAKSILSYINTYPAEIRFAEQLMRNYHYKEGLKILERLSRGKKDAHSKEVLANAYFKARDYQNAKELYQELIDKRQVKGGFYLLRLAKSAARTNDFELAIDTYKKLLRGATGGTRTKYLYKLGFLYVDSNQYEKAIEPFEEILNSGYRGGLRENIVWNLAWSYYKLGKYNEAINHFQKYKDGGFEKQARSRASYWIAKSYEKTGNKSKADDIYSDLVSNARLSYYGFLSSKNIGGHHSLPNSWLSDSEVIMPGINDVPQPQTLFAKAAYLSDLGLHDLSFLELRILNQKRITGYDNSATFIKFAKENGDFRAAHLVSIWSFKNLLYEFPKNEDFRHFVWEAWYPEAFKETASKYAKEFGVDELIVYSIMREESRFQSDVVSRADAIGLMQIIPSTAMKLAKALGRDDFQLKEMFNPKINVKFGTKYLSDLSKMFSGEKAYIIASYNAGEEAVTRWKKDSDAEDIEEFIEEIPYKETNKYVKRVLKSYWIYEELY